MQAFRRQKKRKHEVWIMKISVVTVYDGLNFGSFLQAYAMQAYLKEQGHQVYFVQFDFGTESAFFVC